MRRSHVAYLLKQAEEAGDVGLLCSGLLWSQLEIKKEPKPHYAQGSASASASAPHCCHSHPSPSNNEQHFRVS